MAGMYILGLIWVNIIPDNNANPPNYNVFLIILLVMSIFTAWFFNKDLADRAEWKRFCAYILLFAISLPVIFLFINLIKSVL
jgi:hypothetical protein